MRLVVFCALAGFLSLTAYAQLASSPRLGNPAPEDTTKGPGIIALGSPIVWHPTNAPDTFSANVTFSSTPVTVDNGKVSLFQQQVPTGSNGEWDVFYMKTTNGGPLAGDVNAYWNITLDYTLTAAVYFDQVVSQWLVNGTPVSPLNNNIGGPSGICCAALTNPLLSGPTFYNSGFSGPLPAGTQTNWREIFAQPYNIVTQGGINPNTANEFIFALHFTLQGAAPTITSVISASQFGAFPTIAPGSWIEIYGSNLSEITQTWASSNFSGVNNAFAPTGLGGTTATVGGQAAFTYYVSPTQIDVQVPGGVTNGSQPVVVTTEAGSSAPFDVTVNATQPGLLAPSSFDISGTQYVVALASDGTTYIMPPAAISGITSKRARPGDTITLYGIGFGQVNEGIPPGEVASGLTTLAAPLIVSIGGTSVTPSYAGLAPGYVGLYQINVVVPSVAASDQVPVTFTLGSTASTQKLYIAVGN